MKEKWDREELLASLQEFKELYDNKPIHNNDGGMKSGHMFPAWFIVKKLKPKYLIESGIWQGLGTWFFEKASPESKIISIDPMLHYRKYISNNVSYQTTDFLQTNWRMLVEPENTLVFFDDHQNALARMISCKKLGFKYVMFEDNYPEGQGDCMSLKKAFNKNAKHEIIPTVLASEWLKNIVKTYYEMPPIFDLPTNRWGLPWETYASNEPLLKVVQEKYQQVYYEEMSQYTWINYVELK